MTGITSPAIVDGQPQASRSLTDHADELRRASDYAAAEKSNATKKAYRADFADFSAWCAARGTTALPAAPATLAAYVAALADADKKYSTIRRRTAAIAYAHRLKGFDAPDQLEAVKAVLRGIRRTIGTAVTRKAPATARAIAAMLKRLPDTTAGIRDRALLLLGFAAALRRSELVALNVVDLEFLDAGVVVCLRKSKTDQDGEGQFIAVPNGKRLKPVAALRAWLEAAGITAGPVFRAVGKGGRVSAKRLTDRAVANIVKRSVARAGLEAAIFSGHSLRAGFVTTSLQHGVDFFKVMNVTRHRDVDTLRVYDRRATAFQDHAGQKFL